MAKTRTIQLTLELTVPDQRRLLSNSLGRVMNNAVRVGGEAESALPLEGDRERASTLWQDAEELGPLAERLWAAVANAIREQMFQETDK